VLTAQLACAAGPEAARNFGASDAGQDGMLRVQGTTDIAVFAPVLEAYVTRSGRAVSYEQWGSNDLAARTDAACRGGMVPVDLVISSAVDLQVRHVNDGCAQPHRLPETAALPPALRWRDEVWGITREPAVLVYNRRLVPAAEAPRSRFDLIDLLRNGDTYRGRVATYDIEASGLGYLFAFADKSAATTFGSLIEALGRSGAVATCCSAELIDGVIAGDYLIAYNVLGSYALERARSTPDLVVVAPADYTLVLSRAALIPRGAADPAGAADLVDFLLSSDGQAALAAVGLIADDISGEPADDSDAERPIPLSPVLLVGLDRLTRAAFLDLWRATFPMVDPLP
jgi:ABC-type Fe3+ transport system substrate-binding protein